MINLAESVDVNQAAAPSANELKLVGGAAPATWLMAANNSNTMFCLPLQNLKIKPKQPAAEFILVGHQPG